MWHIKTYYYYYYYYYIILDNTNVIGPIKKGIVSVMYCIRVFTNKSSSAIE